MKKLSELYNVNNDTPIKGIKINSKDIQPGDLFVCIMGVKVDRHDYIDEAVNNGASAIVVSKDNIKASVPVIKVNNTNEELPLLCQKFYDNPQDKLNLIGVTGTDGKTSTSTIIQKLLGLDKTGYIGTNGMSYQNVKKDTNNSTPDATVLYNIFHEFVENDCTTAVMEATSEAFFRGRLQNLMFDISIITNITREHLNIHKTFDNYIECKCMLFKQTKKDGYSILNHDDDLYERVRENCVSKVLTYGKGKDNDLIIKDHKVMPNKTNVTYTYQNKDYNFDSPLLGDFNVYNLAAALLACLCQGYDFNELIKNLDGVYVDGRMEMLDTNTPYYVMIDYAHTPNGITKLLNFVHTLDINRSIVVIGSAGERDNLKRHVMGEVVLDNASYAIFTYEDPRSEDPRDIINDMISTAKEKHNNYEIVVDRHEAIKRAVDIAKDKDLVLVLGKGNETYQKLKDKTIYFNDVEEAYKAVWDRENRK